MLINHRLMSTALIILGLSTALVISVPQEASAQAIHACANNLYGDLRVVAAGPCPRGWRPLSRNVTGPRGPIGPQGAQMSGYRGYGCNFLPHIRLEKLIMCLG
jgi:hypothetical protein